MCLTEFVQDQIWLKEYPVMLAGCKFNARMSVVRINDSELVLHSPCDVDEETASAISALGNVSCILAPGSFHYMHIPSAQRAFPEAETYVCPGVEQKCPDMSFDWILGPRAPEAWSSTMDHVLIRGNRFMWEVAIFHRSSKTLLLVDAIENFTDQTEGVSWQVMVLWKLIRMWNRPKPAPEYQLGWKSKQAAAYSLRSVLEWDFDRIIVSHGDNIIEDAKERARKAWRVPLTEA